MSDYGGGQSQQSPPPPQQTAPLPKPQAIITLPPNVYSHKITDTIKLDHEQLANYLSSINYLPDTIHKHAQLLAQIDHDQIKQYGQSIGPNQLPLISLTVPQDSKNSDYNSGDAQMKLNNDDYSAPQQQDYGGGQSNSGYGQQDSYNSQPQQQGYEQPPQQGGYEQQPQQQGYGQQQQAPTKKPCHKGGNSGYQQQQQQQQQQQGYGQQQQQAYGQQQQPQQNSGGYDQANSQEQYGGGNSGSSGYGNEGSNEQSNYNDAPQAPQVEYQGGQMENNNYGGDNSGGNNGYDSGNSGNNYYSNENNEGNNYENQDNGGGQSYSNNNQEGGYGGNSNEDSGNYESSPFDFNFVQEILRSVMNQLEQMQIDPDSLNAYGKSEDSNGGGGYSSGGENQGNGYESQGNGAPQGYESGYSSQANKQGIQLYDRPPEGSSEMINYGYSVNHGSYEQPNAGNAGNYESSYTSSSTRSQATSYGANEPAVILDNKIPINNQENKNHPSTVTYQMPTINLELPKKQIEHIMKAISSKKGRYSQPIMIKASEFKLPTGLNLGKIKTIAFIKSSKLNGLNQLPYLNSQLLDNSPSVMNSNNDYKLVSSATSKKEETKYESSPVLSAYGYGVSMPSSKLYASSASNKKSIILPLKSRSKRLGHSYSLHAASSNIKKSIISALPKISKSKKSIPKAAVVAAAASSTSTITAEKK